MMTASSGHHTACGLRPGCRGGNPTPRSSTASGREMRHRCLALLNPCRLEASRKWMAVITTLPFNGKDSVRCHQPFAVTLHRPQEIMSPEAAPLQPLWCDSHHRTSWHTLTRVCPGGSCRHKAHLSLHTCVFSCRFALRVEDELSPFSQQKLAAHKETNT